jgi:hypothetical protein
MNAEVQIERAYSYASVPTIKRFSQSKAFIRGLMGPFGSGKSSGSVIRARDRHADRGFGAGVQTGVPQIRVRLLLHLAPSRQWAEIPWIQTATLYSALLDILGVSRCVSGPS